MDENTLLLMSTQQLMQNGIQVGEHSVTAVLSQIKFKDLLPILSAPSRMLKKSASGVLVARAKREERFAPQLP